MHPTNSENCLNPTPSKPSLEWGAWVVEELTGFETKGSSSSLGSVLFCLGMEKHYTRNRIAKFLGMKLKTLNMKMRSYRNSVAESAICGPALIQFDVDVPERDVKHPAR